MSDSSRPASRLLLGCLLVPFGMGIPLIGMVAGLWMIWAQELTLRHAAPVRAMVDSVDVRDVTRHELGARPAYEPLVWYHYSVAGRTLVASAVTARIQRGGDLRNALARAHRYRPGATVNAWYDRADPSRAFLEPGRDGFMYVWTALWAALFVFFAVILRRGLTTRVPPAVA